MAEALQSGLALAGGASSAVCGPYAGAASGLHGGPEVTPIVGRAPQRAKAQPFPGTGKPPRRRRGSVSVAIQFVEQLTWMLQVPGLAGVVEAQGHPLPGELHLGG